MFDVDAAHGTALAQPAFFPAGEGSAHGSARVVVAYRCPLVRAGLVHTLSRVPGLQVQVLDHDALTAPSDGAPLGSIFIADPEAAGLLRARAGSAGAPAHGQRVVVVGSSSERGKAAPAGSGATVWLPLHCREEELVNAMAKLSSSAPAGPWTVAPTRPRGGLAPGAARRIRETIEQRLAERVTLDELAQVAGLSACHFSRAFKQTMGVSPHRYLMLRRTERAAQLIRETSRPLTEIAFEVGFSDQSHFTRMFARLLGMTPGAYRQKHR